jgi:hypothetical protein
MTNVLLLWILLTSLFTDCGTLTAPVDGDVSMTGSFYLDTATFVCEQGYNMTGSQTLTCQYGGSWNGSPPTCLWGGSGNWLFLIWHIFN